MLPRQATHAQTQKGPAFPEGDHPTSHGTVSGRVTDPTGAVIVGASVKLVNPATGTALNDTSNKAGEFNFAELPVGQYDLTIVAPGF